MMKKSFVGIFIFLTIISVLFLVAGSSAKAQEAAGSSSEISKKLDDISSAQKEILQTLASIREELNIVKIRVTQQQ